MKELNDVFENIFVITLLDIQTLNGENRSETIKERFKDLKYDIFPGVDGRYVDKGYYEKKGSKLSYGQLGCALSHINLYKKIIDENLEISLILEDDCVFYDEIKNIVDYMKKIPSDWEMIYLGYLPRTVLPKKIDNGVCKITIDNFCRIEGTHSLIFKKSFAEKIYNFNKNLIYPADGALWEFISQNKETCYAFVPSLTNQAYPYSHYDGIIAAVDDYKRINN